jgi:transposase-like protein/ssDNA-binding Zn-finger/Zn-ribbon topoisomerase 1
MSQIISYLLLYNQYLLKQINYLLLFIAKFIPLKQLAFDDSNSPSYQKFKTDKLPVIKKFFKQDYTFLLEYFLWKEGKPIKPVQRRNGKSIPEDTVCPLCGAPHQYLYDNNGGKGQYQCKVCGQTFITGEQVTSPLVLICPYCGHTLVAKKDRKHFTLHKCVNKNCSYYKSNLKHLPENLDPSDKYKYKLHYIYREFSLDFFSMDLNALPSWATGFKYKKNSAHIMGLCLTYHVNLALSLRKTAEAMREIHNINISHTMVANYAKTASAIIKPFVDSFDYNPSNNLAADETYIKIKGLKAYVWLIMDTVSRSILGYQVSNSRDVGPCILTMRMAFDKFKEFPSKALKFISDGYSAYPLAAQQFNIEKGLDFDVTQVIGLANDDAVSKKYRPFKQKIERLNRTFKASYRVTCGYGTDDGAYYGVNLWVAYYNFLRPHELYRWSRPLNEVDTLKKACNMPGKWQYLIYLGQQTILNMQENLVS